MDLAVSYITDMIKGLPTEHLIKVSLMTMVFLPKWLADEHNILYGDKYPATETCFSGKADQKKVDVKKLVEQSKTIRKMYADKFFLFYQPAEDELTKYFYKSAEFMDNIKCIFLWFSDQILANWDMAGLTRCYPVVFGNALKRFIQECVDWSKNARFQKGPLKVWKVSGMFAVRRGPLRIGTVNHL